MNGTELLLVCILIMLTAIVAELGVIVRSLLRSPQEGKTAPPARDAPPQGQTINVNLTPLAPVPVNAQTAQPQSAAVEQPSTAATRLPENASEKTAREETVREEAREASQRPVRVNAFAVKCPKCGAENSSYRTECFNCGQAL